MPTSEVLVGETMSKSVWQVWGFDVGGNNGNVVVAVFDNEEAALAWAKDSPERKLNSDGAEFDVEEITVFSTTAEALGHMVVD